ncbi:MAG: DUF86 domain-containing protein [Nitrospirota bacterium]
MELNPDKVRKITSEILTSLERLEELKRLHKDAFLSDPHKISSAKYNFIVAIEGIVDLCNHLIAKNAFRTPEDYADTFKVLAEKGAFDRDFTGTLIQMARFRNRLVHIYWEVNSDELHHILTTRLDDVRRFLKQYGAFAGLA